MHTWYRGETTGRVLFRFGWSRLRGPRVGWKHEDCTRFFSLLDKCASECVKSPQGVRREFARQTLFAGFGFTSQEMNIKFAIK